MIAKFLFYVGVLFSMVYSSFLGDGWMRPVEKDVNPSNSVFISYCWKCEPTPEELTECDPTLLTNERRCGTVRSRFEERGIHCIVQVFLCQPRVSAFFARANFIVARGRLVDSPYNNSSLRYFALNSPAGTNEVIVPCTLNGTWEAVLPTGERVEVSDVQCITSSHQTMNHISPYISEIYR